MCSPTRAALLTGRNHHAVGMGGIPELSGGFPGYSAMLPKDAAPFPKVLKENGYSTAAIGKWHLTPEKEQGPAGPFDHWPNAWGFDYYWGFLAPEAEPVRHDDRREPEVHRRSGGEGRQAVLLPRGDDRSGDRLAARRPGPRLREAVVPLLLDRLQPRAPSRLEGVVGEVQGPVRSGLGQAARGDVRAPEEARRRPGRRAAHAARRVDARLGLAGREQQARVRAPDGGVRRLFGERRPSRRPAAGRDRGDGRARGHDRDLDLGRQRRQPRGHPDRHVQRGDDGQRPPADRRGADAAHAEVGRARGVGHRDDVPALLDGLGVGGEHAVSVGQAGRLASRRHAQPAGRPLPAADQGRRRPALAVHARDRHRPDDPRHGRDPPADACRRRRAAADDRRELRRLAHRRERSRAPHAAVLRELRQPGDVQGRLVAVDADAAHPVAADPPRC